MINTIIEILATVSDTVMLVWFIPKFVNASLRKRPFVMIIPAIQLAVQLMFDRLMPGYSILPAIVLLAFAFGFAVALSPRTIWWDALAGVAFVLSMMLVSTLLFSLFSLFIENIGDMLQGNDTRIRVIYLIVAKLVLFACYKLLLILFRKEKSIETSSALLSLALTLGTAAALSALVKIIAADESGAADIPVLVVTVIICITNTILYLFINRIQKLQKSKYELSLLNERTALEKKQSEDANAIWNSIRKVRHDIKNHLSVMKGCLEKGETDACIEYINDLSQTVESMGDLIRSGNSVIDYLINSKLSDLEGVQVLITGCVGNFKDIKDPDMVCILGNILDNAVEAVKNVSGSKRIELYFSKINQNRLMLCKNSVDAPVLDKNKELKTTKKDKMQHGFGHQIIEATAEKYGGFVGYFDDDGMFGVQVSIPEPIESK